MWRGVAVAFLMFAPASSAGAQDGSLRSVAEELKWRVEALRVTGSLRVGDRLVSRSDLTLGVYERSGFLQLWTDRRAVASLLRAIVEVRQDGLDPEDYHLAALAEGPGPGSGASGAAEMDLLSTDAFVRISHDLRFGKVEPQGPTSAAGTPSPFVGEDAVRNLLDVVASNRVQEALADLRLRHFVYEGLMGALADLRRLQSAGGWDLLPSGPTIHRDSLDARVPLLRRRLGLADDPGGQGGDAALRFDDALEAAVKSFQHRHGLNEDGLVGSSTLEALNVPVERRIDQVRVNLERARWITHELPDTLVVVNVAGAKAYLLRGDSVALETRAIVGADYTRTPVFTAPMFYVDLNPTWTVPRGIVGEVLQRVKREPGYLASQGIRVLDGSGRAVDPSEIDFARYTASDFPYVFRQDPGPANALGRIKLMFPNEYDVYLHDTPARQLFAREERLFSHGCIRIQDPVGLAELVIGDPVQWNRETLQAAIDSRVTRTIRLARSVPVVVLYWTASADLHGELHFYRDVYDRDAPILAALDAVDGTLGGRDR